MKTIQQIRAELDQVETRRRRLRKELRQHKGLPPKKKGQGVRIGDRDDALKAARGYVEPGSFVRRDGSEKLVGRDWKQRVHELWLRAAGRCEAMDESGMARCIADGRDPDHKIKRSVRRDDRLSNLQLLCGTHHDLKHPEFKVRSGKLGK